MEATDNLQLPYLMPSQAQKHVTHNEALAMLDAIVQIAVLDRDLTSPPGSPEDGDRHIVAVGATGEWTGQDGSVAVRRDGAWFFLSPRTGWLAFVADEGEFFHFDGSAWQSVAGAITTLQNLALLGIGTAADGTNPFAAKLNKVLWTARSAGEGGDGDLRYTLNKEAAANVLSLLMQSGWSARAELGLIGDDNLSLKVSPDGASWTTALSIDRTSGATALAADPTAALGAATKQYADGKVAKTGDTMTGILNINPGDTGGAVTAQRATNTQSGAPSVTLQRSRAANGAVQNGDYLAAVIAQGWSGSSYVSAANFSFRAAQNFTSSVAGTDFVLRLADFGGTTLSDRLFVTAEGHVALGSRTNIVIDTNRHHRLRSYTVATLPSASPAGQTIYVSDGSSNRRLAVSDGSNWRFADGAVVS